MSSLITMSLRGQRTTPSHEINKAVSSQRHCEDVGQSSLMKASTNNKQIASGLLRIPRKARNDGSINILAMTVTTPQL